MRAPGEEHAGFGNALTKERGAMAQILTIASIVALVGWLGWRGADRLFERRQQASSAIDRHTMDRVEFERSVYRASAQDFLRGAADLTFGIVILGLGFFMLMWVIATA
jgi:hypothetical protein